MPGAYLNYAPPAPAEPFSAPAPDFANHAVLRDVPTRSHPIAICPIRNSRTGSTSYRVTGTVRSGEKQRKKVFATLSDAEDQQQIWEMERVHGAAASRPKITHLSQTQLRQAEAAFELLKGEDLELITAVKHALTNKPHIAPAVTFADGLQKFLAERKAHLSQAQYDNYHFRGDSFAAHIGETRLVSEVVTADIEQWLRSKRVDGQPIQRKTWNNLRCDVSAIFTWFTKAPRLWIKSNPVDGVEKYSKKSLRPQGRERLSIEACRKLMAHLEAEQPEWCTYFALALFLGLRPCMRNGEVFELSRCVARDGVDRYFSNGQLHLSAEICKGGEPRQTAIPPNVEAWLKRYPPTPATICPGDHDDYRAIRKKFAIPHDGLRHTAISVFVAKHGSLAQAAIQFGNSENVIRRHYLSKVSTEEAEEFYSIVPAHLTIG